MEIIRMLLSFAQWGAYWWLDGYQYGEDEVHVMSFVDRGGHIMALMGSDEVYYVDDFRGQWQLVRPGHNPYWEEDKKEAIRDACCG